MTSFIHDFLPQLKHSLSGLSALLLAGGNYLSKRNRFCLLAFVWLGIFQFGIQEAVSQGAGEKLNFSPPKQYKMGFQEKNSTQQMFKFVPENETVEQWSKMITFQIFYKLAKMRPTDFEQKMIHNLKKNCPTAEAAHVIDGMQNGYPVSIWIEKFCPDSATGKSKTTYFKAIQGNDAFYVIQKAFKVPMTKVEVIEATGILRAADLCDPRSTKHPCQKPKGMSR